MIAQTKSIVLAVAACGCIGTAGIVIFYSYDSSANKALTTPSIASVPTLDFLMKHSNALKSAVIECNNNQSSNPVAICDSVHSAQAGLLAQQYRNAASSKP